MTRRKTGRTAAGSGRHRGIFCQIRDLRPGKWNELLQFVGVLAIASVVFSFFMAIHTDMTYEQRQVAHHTAFVLDLLGADAVTYEYVVRVPDLNPQQEAIVDRLYTYDLVKDRYQNGVKLKATRLPPEQEAIVDKYVNELQGQGLPVYTSKAVVGLDGIKLDVAIIPDCVGWIGVFAVTALIFAYPFATLRQRGYGVLFAWPIMYVLNILRLSTSMYIAYISGNDKFEFAHDILWSGIFIFLALIVWLVWIRVFAQGKEPGMMFRQICRKMGRKLG